MKAPMGEKNKERKEEEKKERKNGKKRRKKKEHKSHSKPGATREEVRSFSLSPVLTQAAR